MKATIDTKLSRSGKRTMYFPTIEGLRISRTNFSRKWEATNEGKQYISFHGVDKIKNLIKKIKK